MPYTNGAQEGSRTPTLFRKPDFKSDASTIPPPGHLKILGQNCNLFFSFDIDIINWNNLTMTLIVLIKIELIIIF